MANKLVTCQTQYFQFHAIQILNVEHDSDLKLKANVYLN